MKRKAITTNTPVIELKMTKKMQVLLSKACELSGRSLHAEINHQLNNALAPDNTKEQAKSRFRLIRKKTITRDTKKTGLFSGLRVILEDELSTLRR